MGGIKEEQILEVLATGAHGIGVVTAISTAPSPAHAAQELLAKLP
ncbi:MAG: hypothetical protein AB7P69_26725 [Candidatus Binatia bacterium]